MPAPERATGRAEVAEDRAHRRRGLEGRVAVVERDRRLAQDHLGAVGIARRVGVAIVEVLGVGGVALEHRERAPAQLVCPHGARLDRLHVHGAAADRLRRGAGRAPRSRRRAARAAEIALRGSSWSRRRAGAPGRRACRPVHEGGMTSRAGCSSRAEAISVTANSAPSSQRGLAPVRRPAEGDEAAEQRGEEDVRVRGVVADEAGLEGGEREHRPQRDQPEPRPPRQQVPGAPRDREADRGQQDRGRSAPSASAGPGRPSPPSSPTRSASEPRT